MKRIAAGILMFIAGGFFICLWLMDKMKWFAFLFFFKPFGVKEIFKGFSWGLEKTVKETEKIVRRLWRIATA